MRCLDLGCGPGEVMRLLAERVGPSGQVTGLDNDARIGMAGLEHLRATVPGRFEFVPADVEAIDEVPGAPFDLVIARLLLFHLNDPVGALRKMHAWTRPGGLVIVQDYDGGTTEIVPRPVNWAEYERINQIPAKVGRDLRFGQKLPLHFAAAGIGAPDGTDVAGLLLPMAEIGDWFRTVYECVRPAAIRLGLTTEADGDAFLAELAEAVSEGRGIGMLPLLISAWKRR